MLLDELVCKYLKKVLDYIVTDLLSNEVLDSVIVKLYLLLLDNLRIRLLNLAYDLTACELLDKEGCTSCCVVYYKRIGTTLLTEGSVSLETMSL